MLTFEDFVEKNYYVWMFWNHMIQNIAICLFLKKKNWDVIDM